MGITVVAAFLFAATAIAVFIGLDLLFPVRSLDWIWRLNQRAAGTFRPNARLGGIFLLLVAVAASSAARGLLRGRRWAWWLAIGIFAVNGAGDLISFIITRDVLRSASGVVIAGVFLLMLTRRPVRDFFAAEV